MPGQMTNDEREFYDSTGPQMQDRAAESPIGNAPPLHHDATQAAISAADVATATPANERPLDIPLINGWVLGHQDALWKGETTWWPVLMYNGERWDAIGPEKAAMLRALAGRIQELEASNSRQAGIFSTERTAHAAAIRRSLELEAELDLTKRLLKGSHDATLAITESWDQAETRSRELEAALRAVEWVNWGHQVTVPPESYRCMACGAHAWQGHAPECSVGRALAGGTP